MKKILTILFLLLVTFFSYAQEHKVSFLFAGDAMQHKAQISAAKINDGYDYSLYFEKIKDKVKAADISVVNLEVTLAGPPYTGYPTFGAPDEYGFALKDAGFNIFLTANNHCVDKRKKGLERTIMMLDSMKVKHTGTFTDSVKRDLYYPLMMIKNGIRIAMLNCTYGTNGIPVDNPNVVNMIDKKQIKKDIEAAKQMKADIIIANMHWGEEYKLKQNKEQESLAQFLIDNGVRLVIGNHPHVVQPLDIRRNADGEIDAVVVYSLGNLISAMKPANTTGGMLLNIDISKEKNMPVRIDTCHYSLVWTHKTVKNGAFSEFQLLPVEDYYNDEGKNLLGEALYQQMKAFADNAKAAIESICPGEWVSRPLPLAEDAVE